MNNMRTKYSDGFLCTQQAAAVCWGPAPVDPGNSKRGQHWRGKTYLFRDIRLD